MRDTLSLLRHRITMNRKQKEKWLKWRERERERRIAGQTESEIVLDRERNSRERMWYSDSRQKVT